jgi:transposase
MEFDNSLSSILDIQKPWYIRELDVHKGTKSVNVYIDYDTGTTFKYQNCEQACKVHHSKYRVWRHLDVIKYR